MSRHSSSFIICTLKSLKFLTDAELCKTLQFVFKLSFYNMYYVLNKWLICVIIFLYKEWSQCNICMQMKADFIVL